MCVAKAAATHSSKTQTIHAPTAEQQPHHNNTLSHVANRNQLPNTTTRTNTNESQHTKHTFTTRRHTQIDPLFNTPARPHSLQPGSEERHNTLPAIPQTPLTSNIVPRTPLHQSSHTTGNKSQPPQHTTQWRRKSRTTQRTTHDSCTLNREPHWCNQ